MTLPTLEVREGRIGMLDAYPRMPFRFGTVTLDTAASATLSLDVMVNFSLTTGYASDLLAYKWFDKRPEKSPADNVADLLWVLQEALRVACSLKRGTLFELWQRLDVEIDRRSVAAGFNRLGASFGVSMLERAMIDALGRALGKSFFELATDNLLGLRPTQIHPELDERSVRRALPAAPLRRVWVRHTVGLVDPIDDDDIQNADRPRDGLPETLACYLDRDQLKFLKIKLSGQMTVDIERLTRVAKLLNRTRRPIAITLDGNEQYRHLDEFAALVGEIRAMPALEDLFHAILFFEQPLERAASLSHPLDTTAMATIAKPLLIDEADGWTSAYREAIALGYSGVSHKNCKGVIRSLLNNALAYKLNQRVRHAQYFLSAEDLTCLPVVSLQADLAVVATLGIEHVERNGHHYFRGLDHLPLTEARQALAAHGDLYLKWRGGGRVNTDRGFLEVDSLQTPGLGCACVPDICSRTTSKEWSFRAT